MTENAEKKTFLNTTDMETKDKTESQNRQILIALLEGDKLTPLTMLTSFDSLRASARIYDLRKRGWNIKTNIIKTSSGKHVAEYSLEKYDL